MDGDRHDLQAFAYQHHHGVGGLAAGEGGEDSVWPGKPKPALAKVALLIGFVTTALAAAPGHHGSFDRLLDDCGVGGVWTPGGDRSCDLEGQNGEGVGKHRRCGGNVGDGLYPDASPKALARSVSTAGSPSSTKGGIEAARAPQKASSVMSGPIRRDRRGSAQGVYRRGHRGLAIRTIERPRHSILLAIFNEGVLAHVAQQALGPDAELLFHQLHLGLLPLLRIALDGVLAADRIGLDRRA